MVNQDYVKPPDFVEGDRRRRPHPLRLRAARRRVADAAGDDRGRPAAHDAGREPRRRRALVPARLRAPDRGDAVRLRSAPALIGPAGPAGRLPPEPRPRARAAVPHQPLGDDRADPAPERRREGQRLRAAAGARADVRAHPRPPADPAGPPASCKRFGDLLPGRRARSTAPDHAPACGVILAAVAVDAGLLRRRRDFRLLFIARGACRSLGAVVTLRRGPVPGLRDHALLARGRPARPSPVVPLVLPR